MTQFEEMQIRFEIVKEARSWLYTPHRNGGVTKGKNGGVDCGTFIFHVFNRLGFIKPEDVDKLPKNYRIDWFHHATEEWYQGFMARHVGQLVPGICVPTEMQKMGNIVMMRPKQMSKVFCHGGIITGWPQVVHVKPPCCCESDIRKHRYFMNSEIIIFDPLVRPDCSEK